MPRLIGNYYDWGRMMVDIIKEIQAGTWKERASLATVAGGQLQMTLYGAGVPESAKPLLDKTTAEFKGRTRNLWAGPIQGQDGTVIVPAGTVLVPDKVTEMNFFVEGVVGTLAR
jgi:basic membrane protein A and related proteins